MVANPSPVRERRDKEISLNKKPISFDIGFLLPIVEPANQAS